MLVYPQCTYTNYLSHCVSHIIVFRFVGVGEDPQVLAQRAPELFEVRSTIIHMPRSYPYYLR